MERNERQAEKDRQATWFSIACSLAVLVALAVVLWRLELLRTDAGDPMRWTETIDGRTVEIEVRSRPGEDLDAQYARLKQRWRVATRRD